jgi:hypothetical protein
MEKLLSAQDVADRWNVKTNFVLKRTSPNWVGLKLPFVMLGTRSKRFRLAEVEQFERFHEGREGKEEPITGIHD